MRLWRLVQEGAGVSRRKAQELVRAGEVEFEGEPVFDPYLELDPDAPKTLYLRGQPLSLSPRKFRVYLYHKPRGVLCSHDDPHTGNTIGRVLRSEGFIGYTWAGRLDRDAEGLVLLANNGNLIARLTHPRYQVRKVYHVFISNPPSLSRMREIFSEMKQGIADAGETLRIVKGEVQGPSRQVVLTLTEGHKHEIKRLFRHFGLAVARLKRVAIGPVKLPSDLPPGKIIRMGKDELSRLYAAVGLTVPSDL